MLFKYDNFNNNEKEHRPCQLFIIRIAVICPDISYGLFKQGWQIFIYVIFFFLGKTTILICYHLSESGLMF